MLLGRQSFRGQLRAGGILFPLVLFGLLGLWGCGLTDAFRGTSEYGPSPCPGCVDGAAYEADGAALSDILPDLGLADQPEAVAPEPLAVTAVEPPEGDASGGEIIMLKGTGFVDGLKVLFGDTPGAKVFVINSTLLTVETPGHEPGLVDLTVVLGDDIATLPDAFSFVAKLTLTGVEPAVGDGAGGQPVMLRGSGFQGPCRVWFGEREALNVLAQSDSTISAVTPPGGCGEVRVRVACDGGDVTQKGLFSYARVPELVSMQPPMAPETGGELLLLKGAGFEPGMIVYFGDHAVRDAVVLSHELAWLYSPASLPGVVDVVVATSCGTGYFPDAFLFKTVPGASSPGIEPLAVTGMIPSRLAACKGGEVTLALNGPLENDDVEIWMDDLPLDLLEVDAGAGLVVALVPPREPGNYEMKVLVEGAATLVSPSPLILESRLSIARVVPDTGLPEGGQWVELEGCGLASVGEVWFGALPAPKVQPLGPQRVRVLTPPGSPGPVDVKAVGLYERGTLAAGFDYASAYPELAFVTPDRGARSGGTFVRLVGSGLSDQGVYKIGDMELFEVVNVNSSLVVGRMPPMPVGSYDVSAQVFSSLDLLTQAFSVFDPGTKSGGTSGGALDESLNVTVYDAGTGKGLAGAFVVVGSDVQAVHQGYTDQNGQITFSLPGFRGKQQVTAAKVGYSLYSVVNFDSTNVSVLLNPTAPSEGSGGTYTPVQAFVTGRVRGLEKYVPLPPGNCANKPVTGVQCRPCFDDAGCADYSVPVPGQESPPGGRCTQIGNTGSFCTLPCLSDEECGEGYLCAQTFADVATCVPRPGERTARCRVSGTSIFGGSVAPGTGSQVNKHGIYFVNSRTGVVAVVCLGGYTDFDTAQFEPVSMGIRRNITVLNNQTVMDQDVELTIPLSHEAKVAYTGLPYHPGGTGTPYLIAGIDLGKDGTIQLPKEATYVAEGRYHRLSRLPNPEAPEMVGTSYSLYASVNAGAYTGVPYSVRMEDEIGSLEGEGVLLWHSGGVESSSPPIKGDAVGLFLRDEGFAIATTAGQFLIADGEGHWSQGSIPGSAEGFSASFEEPGGTIWLGGNRGTVWRQEGSGWTRDSALGLYAQIKDLWAGGASWAALYQSTLARKFPDGTVSVVPMPMGEFARRVWGSDIDDLYIITQSYYSQVTSLYHYGSSGFTRIEMGVSAIFHDVDGSGPDDLFVAASAGRLFRFDGDQWTEYNLGTLRDLVSVRVVGPGLLVVGGEDGQLFVGAPGAMEKIETESGMDLRVLDYDVSLGLGVASGVQSFQLGPFMAFPKVLLPEEGGVFDWSSLRWTFYDPEAKPSLNYFILSNSEGRPFWITVASGEVQEFKLPPLQQMLGVNLMPDGLKRLNVTSSMNKTFNIDKYTNSDLNTYSGATWAVDYISFF